MEKWVALVLLLVLWKIREGFGVEAEEVTYDGRSLIIDGQRKILFSGSIHYPRSTPQVIKSNTLCVCHSCLSLSNFWFHSHFLLFIREWWGIYLIDMVYTLYYHRHISSLFCIHVSLLVDELDFFFYEYISLWHDFWEHLALIKVAGITDICTWSHIFWILVSCFWYIVNTVFERLVLVSEQCIN